MTIKQIGSENKKHRLMISASGRTIVNIEVPLDFTINDMVVVIKEESEGKKPKIIAVK